VWGGKEGDVEMERNGEWDRYYQRAARQRQANGGDVLDKHLRRLAAREFRWLSAAAVAMVIVVSAYYAILIR